jgi:CRISPR-associated endonuclease/helicase Cas3
VRTMLRGPDRPQVTFVVIDRDTMLRSALESASEIKDRWAKRQTLRHLAGRIARLSVSIYVRDDFDPADFADPFPLQARREDVWFWLLRPGHYTSEEGIDFGEKIGDDVWGTII